MLEKAQETLGRQNLGIVGLEAAKVQLSELVSKVSSQCLNSAFSELKELQGLCPQNNQPTDCSMDSCLTSCEGSQKEQEIQNGGMGLRPFNGHAFMEQKEAMEVLKWCDEVKKNNTPTFLSNPLAKNGERRGYAAESSPSNLSMSIGLERDTENNGSNMYPAERSTIGRESDGEFHHRSTGKPESVKPVEEKVSQEYRLPYFATARLDLNTREENDAAMSCKQLDLNGFSWS